MKLSTVMSVTTALAATFLVASVVGAGEDYSGDGFSHHRDFMGGHRGEHGPAMFLTGKVMRELDMTPEQRDAVKNVMREASPRLHDVHEARRDVHEQLMNASPDSASYAQVVEKAAQEAAENAARATRLAGQLKSDIWALLTDEQKARAIELREERQQRMAERQADREARRLERQQAEAD